MPSVLLLLAEDDDAVAGILTTTLAEAGYEVIVARNGHDAMQEVETDASRFRAIITDIHLGVGPEGWEIARRTRELMPTMPIVYMSGDSAEEWSANGVPGSVMIAKPFAPAQVVTAISNLINVGDMNLSPGGTS